MPVIYLINQEERNYMKVNRPIVWAAVLVAAAAIFLFGACGPTPAGAPASAPDSPAAEQQQAPAEAPQQEAASAESASPENASAEASQPETSAAEAPQAAEQEQEMYNGVPVGFTAEGHPFRGAADAPVTVYEYSDYQCPFCARHVLQTEPALVDNLVREGKVKFVFRDFPLDSLHPNATPAAVAANCVAQQGIISFWRMHDLLFRTQDEWASAADPADIFARLAADAGADMDLYQACIEDSQAQLAKVQASVAEAQDLGFSGTPSFRFVREADDASFTLVGAQPYTIFSDWIATIAEGGAPEDPAAAQRQQQGEPQIPFWATAEGLAPDPDRPGYTVAGDFWRGDPEAPLVVVEFSDFQCPFCRRHTLNTQPILDEQFIDQGKVMWVFKHFPVQSTHPYAFSAAYAAECAAQQGKFWEIHDLLFQRMEEWTKPENRSVYLGIAEELGLDTDAFAVCLDDPATVDAVNSDLADGSPFVRGTPTFIVLWGDQGRLIPGALPADQFTEALNQLFALATGADAGGN